MLAAGGGHGGDQAVAVGIDADARDRALILDAGDRAVDADRAGRRRRRRRAIAIFSGRRLVQAGGAAERARRSPASSDVGAADEIGDEARARPLVDVARRADLDDAAVVEDGDAVGHRQRLALVVGDEDEGDAELALQRLQLDLHLLAELEVERAERLVEQQHLRPVDQRAGERHALALAAGKLRGPARPRSRRA